MKIRTTPRPLGEPPIGALAMVPLFFLPLGAWLIESGNLTLSQCGLKTLAGIPCVSCGSTRATIHLLHGDFATALYYQPMTMLIYAMLLTWGTLSLGALVKRRSLHLDLSRREDLAIKLTLVAIPLANWAYLIGNGI